MADEQQRPDWPSGNPNRPRTIDYATPAGGIRIGRQLIGWFLFIFVGLVLMVIWLLNNQKPSITRISESEVMKNLDKIQSVEIRSDEITGSFSRPMTVGMHGGIIEFVAELSSGEGSNPCFHQRLVNRGILIKQY